jgi:hypothetical protein
MLEIVKIILLVTLGTFMVTHEYSVFLGAALTFCVLFALNHFQEGFTTNRKITKLDNNQLKQVIKSEFVDSTPNNPLSNVLLTDINDHPTRKAAPPSFDDDNTVTLNTKQMVQSLNKDLNTNKDLFGDKSERFQLDQNLRQFYSTANTQVLNNQHAFGNWLYGNMPSAKEGDKFALTQDNPRYNLH